MHAEILKSLTSSENLSLGMLTGTMARTVNYPLLTWKNASQQSLPISFNPSVVYRGLPASCVNYGATIGMQFLLTGFFSKKLSGFDTESNSPSVLTQIGAPLAGGFCAGIPCSILELVMIQQQRFGGSAFQIVPKLVHQFGITSLSRAMAMTVSRESLFTLSMLGLTPAIQYELVNRFHMNKDASLAIGALTSSAFATTVTHPMDTIKTCMQGDMCKKQYTTIMQTANSLVKNHGIVDGLFKGINWRFLQISVGFFMINKLKEVVMPVIFQDKFDKLTQKKEEIP
mmetsp:Transcript_10414/g.12651  ORF Transcript_10414/g.12651 Transcript_10414/m.12651 type:complete len:285 (-) Transcript_10414:117-971(-)